MHIRISSRNKLGGGDPHEVSTLCTPSTVCLSCFPPPPPPPPPPPQKLAVKTNCKHNLMLLMQTYRLLYLWLSVCTSNWVQAHCYINQIVSLKWINYTWVIAMHIAENLWSIKLNGMFRPMGLNWPLMYNTNQHATEISTRWNPYRGPWWGLPWVGHLVCMKVCGMMVLELFTAPCMIPINREQ